MTSVLTIHLNSPMQSFGNHSISTDRESDELPTKSQIIGLFLNAIGHDKYNTSDDSQKMPQVWSNKLRFAAIKTNKIKLQKITDFCIAQRNDIKNEKFKNDIIHKDYIINTKYNVFLEGDDNDIYLVAKSLLMPKRQLYIGRKCCTPSDYLCWDKNKCEPTITKNTRIENVLLKNIDLSKTKNIKNHIIECGDAANFSTKTINDEIKQIIDIHLGKDSWFPVFDIKRKTSPVRFGKQQWGDLLCYKLKYIQPEIVEEQYNSDERYNDMEEIKNE